MQITMRAVSLVNGVAGLARVFGYPLPVFPEEWRRQAQESIELLKQKSTVEKFGVVQERVEYITSDSPDEDVADSVRGASLRELLRLFKQHDPDETYAGLIRYPDNAGYAIWTLMDKPESIKVQRKRQKRQQDK
jgi:hypothetical protein